MSVNITPKAFDVKTNYDPSQKLPPEMTYNLGKKSYKQYLKMKRNKSKPKIDESKEKEKEPSGIKSALSSETKSFMREGIEIAEREIGSPKQESAKEDD